MALVGITLVSGEGFGRLGEVGGLSWYYLIGGLLGAVYVTTVLITVRTLGAGGVTAATIAGQLTLSVVLDQLGVLGLAQRGSRRRGSSAWRCSRSGVVLVVRS